jgi:hypothetical protein
MLPAPPLVGQLAGEREISIAGLLPRRSPVINQQALIEIARVKHGPGSIKSRLRANGSRECGPDDRLRETIQCLCAKWRILDAHLRIRE